MKGCLVPLLAVLFVIFSASASEARERNTQKPNDEELRNRKKGNERNNCKQRNCTKQVAAHLIGINSTGDTLNWDHTYDMAFTHRNVQYKNFSLVVNHDGLYYVYCQIGFEGKQAKITLFNEVYAFKHSTGVESVLLAGTESVVGPPSGSTTWYASLSQGGLAKLKSGDRLYVNVMPARLVDYREGKTFFGLVKVM
ncbi:lymphotoxin-beta [Pelobates fuscus]|uniref:lymphotoxin-beta n=1 Tax=Pelobates fuscus TaxID=191477 RepID=UPI002FE4C9C8